MQRICSFVVVLLSFAYQAHGDICGYLGESRSGFESVYLVSICSKHAYVSGPALMQPVYDAKACAETLLAHSLVKLNIDGKTVNMTTSFDLISDSFAFTTDTGVNGTLSVTSGTNPEAGGTECRMLNFKLDTSEATVMKILPEAFRRRRDY